jgi:hypothetical protein
MPATPRAGNAAQFSFPAPYANGVGGWITDCGGGKTSAEFAPAGMDTVLAPFAVTDEWQSQSSPLRLAHLPPISPTNGVGGMPPTPLPSHQPSAIKPKDATSDRYQSGVHVRRFE